MNVRTNYKQFLLSFDKWVGFISHDKILLEPVKSLPGPTEYLNARLSTPISNEAKNNSLKRIRQSNFWTLVSSLLLIFCVGFLLLTVIAWFVKIKAPIDFQQTPGNTKLNYSPLYPISFFALMSCAGFTIRRKLLSRDNNPLAENGTNTFKTKEDAKRWNEFHSWALANHIILYVGLSEGRLMKIPTSIWNKHYLVAFILGSEQHRAAYIKNNIYIPSTIKISAEDWKQFEKSQIKIIEKEQIDGSPSSKVTKTANSKGRKTSVQSTKAPKTVPKTNPVKPWQTLPNRIRNQKSSTWGPRSELLLSDAAYLKKYKDMNLQIVDMKAGYKPCHKALLVLEANSQHLNLIFKKTPDSDEVKAAQASLLNALEIVGESNYTRFQNLHKRKWKKLEEHLESIGIISNEELAENNLEVKQFFDSGGK